MEAKVARTSAVCHNSHRESECRTRSSQEGRAFLCCPYVGDEQGRYRPTEGISQCPSATGAERCCLKKHAWRERKTGPCVPLRLMYCRSHDRHFTVYPMGHVPYSRRRVLPVDLTRTACSWCSPTASTSAPASTVSGESPSTSSTTPPAMVWPPSWGPPRPPSSSCTGYTPRSPAGAG
jgi:hypothetical protein